MYAAAPETDAAPGEILFWAGRLFAQDGFTGARMGERHTLQRLDVPSPVVLARHRENQRIH